MERKVNSEANMKSGTMIVQKGQNIRLKEDIEV